MPAPGVWSSFHTQHRDSKGALAEPGQDKATWEVILQPRTERMERDIS